MRIVTVISTLFFVSTFIASPPALALDLAPQQDEGPSLEETLKFIKDKVYSLRGFIHWNTGGGNRTVEYTSFEVDSNYIATMKQKTVGPLAGIEHDVCDLKEIHKNYDTSHDSSITLYFGKNCIKYGGFLNEYPKSPPFLNGSMDFDTGDSDVKKQLVKAFNHLAELMQKMPKKRSNELF